MPTNVVNQQGPLPIKVNMAPEITGPATLVVAGSVWSGTANQMIGIVVEVDGTIVGKATIFSNGASTHRAVVPIHIPISLDKEWTSGPPSYELTLAPLNAATVSDVNDNFNVSLIP